MKWGSQLAFGISILVTVIYLATVFSGLENFNTLADDQKRYSDLFNFGIAAVMAFTIVAVVVGVLFGFWQLVQNPKGSLKGIIGFVVLIVLIFIAISMSSDDLSGPIAKTVNEFKISSGLSKTIGGAIFATLSLTAVAFLAAVLGEIRGFFK